MKFIIINGPNLNMLGMRDTFTYGKESFEQTLANLREALPEDEIIYFQSNSEGEIIDCIQKANLEMKVDGIVINPGAYAHYSHAIADAMAESTSHVVEVHISNIFNREDFRAKTVTARGASAVIAGCDRMGYRLAIDYLKTREEDIIF